MDIVFMHSLQACEPVPVFYVVYLWPQVITLEWFAKGLGILAAVVGIKALLFCFVGKINPLKGIPVMVIANAVSTIPGILLAAMMIAFPIFLDSLMGLGIAAVSMVLYYAVTAGVANKFISNLKSPEWSFLNPGTFVGGSLGLGFLSVVLSLVIRRAEFETTEQVVYYWAIKYCAVFLGLLISIALTICWEGAVTCTLLKKDGAGKVLRATVVTNLLFFFSIFLIAACMAWPERMKNRDWLLPPK